MIEEYIKKSDLMEEVVPEVFSDYTEEDVIHADVINTLPVYSFPDIENIKAEIKSLIDWHDCPIEIDGGNDSSYCDAVNLCLEIIDKYIAERSNNG